MPSILILTNRIPYPLHDGGALAMDAMIRGYKIAGWNVHLLSMNTSRHRVPTETMKKLYPDIDGFHAVGIDNAVKTTGILKNLLFSREPEHVDRFKSHAFTHALVNLLQDMLPDVVQLESPFLGVYISKIRKNAPKARIVYRMHNVEGQIWGRLALASTGIKKAYLRQLAARMTHYELKLWSTVDLIMPITAADAAIIEQASISTPIEIAHFGITIPQVELSPAAGLSRIYHIGAMDWLPNQEAIRWFLTEVWPDLHAASPELTFHFAGRAMPPSFHQDLPEGAFCAGEVPDAAAFARDKQILVVPLRAGSGVRIKTLEAMASGKLVISTDVGMQGVEVRDGQHYLSANNAAGFIRAAAWANKHPEEASTVIRNATQLIRTDYNAKEIMERITRRLQTLITS
jgi:glycosyltransferase involved in cell wall biosynthesis